MLRDREAKLYCAGSGWTRREGVNPFVGAQVRSAGFSRPVNTLTTESTEDTETVHGEGVNPGLRQPARADRTGESAIPNPQPPIRNQENPQFPIGRILVKLHAFARSSKPRILLFFLTLDQEAPHPALSPGRGNPSSPPLSCHMPPSPGGAPFFQKRARQGDRDRKSTRLNSSHTRLSRMPSSA